MAQAFHAPAHQGSHHGRRDGQLGTTTGQQGGQALPREIFRGLKVQALGLLELVGCRDIGVPQGRGNPGRIGHRRTRATRCNQLRVKGSKRDNLHETIVCALFGGMKLSQAALAQYSDHAVSTETLRWSFRHEIVQFIPPSDHHEQPDPFATIYRSRRMWNSHTAPVRTVGCVGNTVQVGDWR